MKSPILLLTSLLFLIGCGTYNDIATDNVSGAVEAILDIKKSGVVVIFPTYRAKESALLERSKINASYAEDLADFREDRADQLKLWQEHKNLYSFSDLFFLPDSLLKNYLADSSFATMIDTSNNLIVNKEPISRIYIFYKEYGGFEVKQNNLYVSNPFPNKVGPAVGSAVRDFLGVQSEEKSTKRFFSELEKRFSEFYYAYGRN